MDANRTLNRRRGGLTALVLACGLLTASAAVAAEPPTREEYVDQLEQICKPDAEATQRTMKGARADIKAERLRRAAEKFAAAASIFGSTVEEISAVPRPAADRAKLSRWFGFLRKQESYLQQITVQLRRDRPTKAQRLTSRFIHNGNLANHVTLAFGFNYCSFKFSRYG